MRTGDSSQGIARKRTQADESKTEMVFSSPLFKWNKSEKDEVEAGDMELLQELITLNNALDQHETKRSRSLQHPIYTGKQMPAAAAPSPKKYSLFSGRGLTSTHESRNETNDDASVVQNEAKRFFPPLYPRPLSMDIPAEFTQEPVAATFHHSFSDSPHGFSAVADRQPDIRTRKDRTSSLEGPKLQHANESYTPEKNPGFGERFDASSTSETKKSLWSWKPLRALSHLGRQRFHCGISLHVHEIVGLPPTMDGLRLCVHMRKMETKEGAVETMPSRVFRGIAEFEETLCMKCTLYSNRGYSNVAKFLPKDIIISVMSPDMDEINFGKHHISLSKLLSFLMDGQFQGRNWNMKFDLTGKAKEARLVVTFRFEVLDKDLGGVAHSSSRFVFSSSHRSSSQFSCNFSSSAHSTPGPMSFGYPLSFTEPGDEFKAPLQMESFDLDETIPSIEAGIGHVTDVDKGLLSSKMADVQHVHETQGQELSEGEIEFIFIDQGIETSGPVPKRMIEESMVIGQEPSANEAIAKNADENREIDVDWHVVEISEGESAQQGKEGELLLNWEPIAGNEGKTIQRAALCEHVQGMFVATEGAPETDIHEDENEKIIAVDEGGKQGIFKTVIENEHLPILEESSIKGSESHIIENMELELVTIDITEVIDKSFGETSPIHKNVSVDLDDEIDLVAGEFLRMLESERASCSSGTYPCLK